MVVVSSDLSASEVETPRVGLDSHCRPRVLDHDGALQAEGCEGDVASTATQANSTLTSVCSNTQAAFTGGRLVGDTKAGCVFLLEMLQQMTGEPASSLMSTVRSITLLEPRRLTALSMKRVFQRSPEKFPCLRPRRPTVYGAATGREGCQDSIITCASKTAEIPPRPSAGS